ncbi:MAG: hypothetical protein V2A58_12040, partial [Planctomycetota bacterium]
MRRSGTSTGFSPRVEAALRGLQEKGAAGKTLANRRESFGAFCEWAKTRGYLAKHPLEGSTGFD